MPDIESALAEVARSRNRDPLAPATFIAPSHAAGLQLRRRLAEKRGFAAVRFETLPRVAELLAAGHLAGAGQAPLARPIGDYVAALVAQGSTGDLAGIAALPGYARALRVIFRRLRRGGIQASGDVRGDYGRRLAAILGLYNRYREMTSAFYDEEDLMDAAADALRSGRPGVVSDLGDVYVMPPGALTAASRGLLAALAERVPSCTQLDETSEPSDTRFVLAPDPASEAREVVREVLTALGEGVSLHEIGVFHGADASYGRLLREAFEAARVPAVPLPGIPLVEKPAGRAVLALARLPERDFSRTATMDLLGASAVRGWLPGRDGEVRRMPTAWDRLSRDAGITRGVKGWERSLLALVEDKAEAARGHEAKGEDDRAEWRRREADRAEVLLGVVQALVARLMPLRKEQSAEAFIEAFKGVVEEYVDRKSEALEDVLREVEQLGTVGAVGGSFTLGAFAEALGANLEAAHVRPRSLGEGVVVADYRAAAGMRFKRVVLCGAYEGALPAGPGTDALVADNVWERLRGEHTFVEDASVRVQRAREAAARAVASAGGETLVWSAPLFQPGGTREYYPSPSMVHAAAAHASEIGAASVLRKFAPSGGGDGWFRRGSSPLAVMLTGPVVDAAELGLRQAIVDRRDGRGGGTRMQRAVAMLRARRSRSFTEWDGNVAALRDGAWLDLQTAVSPTSLERYAACGFRYLCNSLLRLNVVEEPEELETMDAAERGLLMHRVLHRFFSVQRERGRPKPGEAWDEDDRECLMHVLEEELSAAERRGLTGLDIYARHEARVIAADLSRFLDEDTLFRRETGAVPAELETYIPEVEVAGVRLKGVVDRIDRTPDGGRAWVIDYKTGGLTDFEAMRKDPLAGGTKLQLPVYLAAAADAADAKALYWFITHRGGFETREYEPTPENQVRFAGTVEAIVGGVRAGAFPAVSGEENDFYGDFDGCRYCDYTRICSRRRDYDFAAKREDPDLAPWLAVGQAASGGEGE